MATPVAAFIQLPDDSGNTGKKNRSQTRVVGANTVHEHFVVCVSKRSYVGFYWANVPFQTIPTAAQNGTSTGNWWLFNPVGSANKITLRRFSTMMQFAALGLDLVPGQFRMSLFTFTGTASGAQITLGKADSTYPAPTANLRTAMTGLTITLGATIWEELGPVHELATGGAGVWNPLVGLERNPDDEDAEIILRAGEGVVDWSALALTTANRRQSTNIGIGEFE